MRSPRATWGSSLARELWRELGRLLERVLRDAIRAPRPRTGAGRGLRGSGQLESPGQYGPDATRDVRRAELQQIRIAYAPDADGDPDPGEIVWTWVPYVENDGRGKDRPVLIIGRLGSEAVVGCSLSTKQRRGSIPVGAGGWDSQGRESYLSTERILRVTPTGMRREGHVLPRDRFDAAVQIVARKFGIAG